MSTMNIMNTLQHLVNPAVLAFLLIFSAISSVFGNAGQSACCTSQLYVICNCSFSFKSKYLTSLIDSAIWIASLNLCQSRSPSLQFLILECSSVCSSKHTKGCSSSKTALKIGVTTRPVNSLLNFSWCPSDRYEACLWCSRPVNLFYTITYSWHGFWLNRWITNMAWLALKPQLALRTLGVEYR